MREPQIIHDDGVRNFELAYAHPASAESVQLVLDAGAETDDGRSGWMWLRLRNGDLMLGVFPRGATYEAVEIDAAFPDKDIPKRSLPIPNGWCVIAYRAPRVGEQYFGELYRIRPYRLLRPGDQSQGTTGGKKWIVVPTEGGS